MDEREAHAFYADPANLRLAGPARKRRGQRLTSMVPIRFQPEVIGAATVLAKREGMTVSGWIRRLVLREVIRAGRERPAGLIEGPGRAGAQKALASSLGPGSASCPHFAIGNVTAASCAECGPLPVMREMRVA